MERHVTGISLRITVDNGPKFINHQLDTWAQSHGITFGFIALGKTIQNDFIESFNGELRDEYLDRLVHLAR